MSEILTPVITVTVSNPTAGADWSFTLPTPARILKIASVLATGATVSARIPTYEIGGIYPRYPLCTSVAGQTANQGIWYVAEPGPLTTQWGFEVGNDNCYHQSIPLLGTVMWPTGTVIASVTIGGGLAPTDQWENITLTLSAV